VAWSLWAGGTAPSISTADQQRVNSNASMTLADFMVLAAPCVGMSGEERKREVAVMHLRVPPPCVC